MINKTRVLRHLFVVSLVVLACAAVTFPQRGDLSTDLGRSFREFEIGRLDAAGLKTEGLVSVESAAGSYEVLLYPRDLRSRRYLAIDSGPEGRSLLSREDVRTYAGTISGDDGSSVRLTVRDGVVEGFMVTGGERFLIESAARYSGKAKEGQIVIYRPGDHLDDDGYTCLSEFEQRLEKGKDLAFEGATRLTGPGVIELATEADYQFVNELGGPSQANQEILSILNMVEGTFQQEMELSISVVFQHTWTTPDPFDGSNGGNLLNSFKAYWNSNFPTAAYPRDTAHLFSSKPNVASMGIAFLGTVCRSPLSAYGLSGRITWAPGKYLVTAHELGHNLKANHADSSQGCGNTLMNPVLSGATPMTFCPYSRTEMSNFLLADGDCLAPPEADSVADFDFDGDARSDVSVWRPSTGVWYIYHSTGAGFSATQFGMNGDKPVPSDYDGDGKTDPAVYREGIWYVYRSSDGSFVGYPFGLPSDLPAPADFDGDGKTDSAVYRPDSGVWFIMNSSNGGVSVSQFGLNGDVPLPADYDGDGKADLNVWRPSNGVWYLMGSGSGFSARQFGQIGDKPVRGDFDGDGRKDPAVYRPSTGTWYVLKSSTGGYFAAGFGLPTDIPTPGDYDGDGIADLSVFRPETGIWYTRRSGNGSVSTTTFGVGTDMPAPSSYLP